MTPTKLGFVMAALFSFGGAYLTIDQQAISTALFSTGAFLIGLVMKEVGAKQ